MNRPTGSILSGSLRVPRACGDEPAQNLYRTAVIVRSPRMRG